MCHNLQLPATDVSCVFPLQPRYLSGNAKKVCQFLARMHAGEGDDGVDAYRDLLECSKWLRDCDAKVNPATCDDPSEALPSRPIGA